MSKCNSVWWKVKYCRLPMLALFVLSGQMCPNVGCKMVRIAIVLHNQGACGESFCIAIQLTRLKGCGGGSGMP